MSLTYPMFLFIPLTAYCLAQNRYSVNIVGEFYEALSIFYKNMIYTVTWSNMIHVRSQYPFKNVIFTARFKNILIRYSKTTA